MDSQTGRCLNPNMEFYKLAGINDIGELGVPLHDRPRLRRARADRIGRAADVSPGAVLSNAVANAIGVRVPELPLTPAQCAGRAENSLS